jgi:hypothetical protein
MLAVNEPNDGPESTIEEALSSAFNLHDFSGVTSTRIPLRTQRVAGAELY